MKDGGSWPRSGTQGGSSRGLTLSLRLDTPSSFIPNNKPAWKTGAPRVPWGACNRTPGWKR